MVRNSHTTAQNSRLCVSKDEGYHISRTDQISVGRNSHTTAAQNSRLCVSRDEGCLVLRTDQISVGRNSHTTAAHNIRLCVSRDEVALFCRPNRRRWGKTLTPPRRSTGTEGQNILLPRESEEHRSRRRLKPERLSTREVQQVPHRSKTHAIGVHAHIRADSGAAKAKTSRAASTAALVSTLVPVDARDSGGSARSRLPYGEKRSRKSTERMAQQWHVQKDRFGQEGLDSPERDQLLYKLAKTCTTIIRKK